MDFPREWVEFADPADPAHLIRADLTWLCSRWICVFGRGCQGIDGTADLGCCAHGAFFSDTADAKRVNRHARELTRADWQRYDDGHRRDGRLAITEPDSIGAERRQRTRIIDGGCVFANRSDFTAGAGCALHVLALRVGRSPIQTKPEVCWQLPIRRAQEWVDRPDDTRILVSTISEFDRRGWGEGGHDLAWYCTGAPAAHIGTAPLYQRCAAELTELLGAPAHAELARLCEARLRSPMIAAHPATTAARPVTTAAHPAATAATSR